MEARRYDTIIIGSGIAGMTASIYLKRENLDVLILEREVPGGQLVRSPLIENYPGYDKVEGPELALTIHNQVRELGVPVSFEEVLEIIDCNSYKKVITNQNEYETRTVLLATGRSPRKLNLQNEDKFLGKGISYCATCDGALYKNKTVAVVGGGNSASIEALFLSNICKKVFLIHRKDQLRSELALQEKLERKENIEIIYEKSIIKLGEENGKFSFIELSDKSIINIDGLFIYIGFTPNVDAFHLSVKKKDGYIVTNENMQTSIAGIYACGDIISKQVYQLTTAVGEASIAAENIKKELIIE